PLQAPNLYRGGLQNGETGGRIMKNRWLRHGALALIDGAVVAGAVVIAFALRFEGQVPVEYIEAMPWMMAVALLARLSVFWAAGLYRSLWRYASVRELVVMTVTTALTSVVLYCIDILA